VVRVNKQANCAEFPRRSVIAGAVDDSAPPPRTAALVVFAVIMALSGFSMIGLFVVEGQYRAYHLRPGEVPWFVRGLLLVGGMGY